MLAWIICSLTMAFFLTPVKGSIQKRTGLLVLINVLMFLPFVGGWPIAFYLVGWFGEFSITLLLWSLSRHIPIIGKPSLPVKIPFALIGVWMILSQVFAGFPDLYSIGFLPKEMLLVLLLIGSLAWYFKQQFLWLTLWLAIPAWWLQLYSSQNLWDYLLDPILTIAIMVSLSQKLRTHYRGKSKLVSG